MAEVSLVTCNINSLLNVADVGRQRPAYLVKNGSPENRTIVSRDPSAPFPRSSDGDGGWMTNTCTTILVYWLQADLPRPRAIKRHRGRSDLPEVQQTRDLQTASGQSSRQITVRQEQDMPMMTKAMMRSTP